MYLNLILWCCDNCIDVNKCHVDNVQNTFFDDANCNDKHETSSKYDVNWIMNFVDVERNICCTRIGWLWRNSRLLSDRKRLLPNE